MKDLVENILLWRLAIVRICIYAFVAGATTYVTSMNGLEWSALNDTQKVCLLLGVFITVGNNIAAFLDRTISRISAGKPIVGDDDEKIKIT